MTTAEMRKIAEALAGRPVAETWGRHGPRWKEVAAEKFIATFDPPTILALLDVVEAAEYVRDAATLTADDAQLTHALEELDTALDRLTDPIIPGYGSSKED